MPSPRPLRFGYGESARPQGDDVEFVHLPAEDKWITKTNGSTLGPFQTLARAWSAWTMIRFGARRRSKT